MNPTELTKQKTRSQIKKKIRIVQAPAFSASIAYEEEIMRRQAVLD